MRIALATEFYYPHLGGITEHVHNLARQFQAAGHHVIVVTSDMGDTSEDGPFVRRIGTSRIIFSNGSYARITTGWRLRAQLRALLREERIDVVHVHGGLTPTFSLVGPLAALDLGIPVVATFHSWFPRSALYRIFRRPLQRLLDRHAAVLAVSQPAVDAMSRYFRADWEIIPNGVDTNAFHPEAPSNGRYAEAGPHLLFLGRLDPRNGLDTALSALPRIARRWPGVRLTVAGDGPLREEFRKMAEPVREHVRFIGAVNGDRPGIYAGADLYLCPTHKASFGITLLEAMACGTPQIVSDVIGFRELVDGGEEALLAPAFQPDAWADAVLTLLDDPTRRWRMGSAGRAKALEYAWPKVARRVLDVYHRVLR